MASLVAHHFPQHTGMFGADAHHSARDSPNTSAQQQRSTPSRSQQDAGAASPYVRDQNPLDKPMTDAPAPPSTSTTSAQRLPQIQTSHFGDGTAQGASSAGRLQEQPPPSPRPRPRSQASQASQTPSALNHERSASFRGAKPMPSTATSSVASSPVTALRSSGNSKASLVDSPQRIKVKSLSHIQSFATDENSPYSQTRSMARRSKRDPKDVGPQYEISEMPVTDIIEMVAGLLTKITSTNDKQHEHLHRQIPPPEGAAGLSQQTTSVLAFHGKNVPSISILSYLSRIHKYCPTTYEVFLSLLVYFDRMTERVNQAPLQTLKRTQESQQRQQAAAAAAASASSSLSSSAHPANNQANTPPPSGSLGKAADMTGYRDPQPQQEPPSPTATGVDTPLDLDPYNLSHFFVVDSFNIHRLVIAGVTCASKFFSDVFYTNSRYAKVGGLPLVELNHLELQFLLLNDFRLAVTLEEMEDYGTMLVEFYAREVVANQNALKLGGPHGGNPPVTAA